ncbi:glucosidase II [Mycoemilia scoparia]|uniref:Glucosidase II subunit alpha n=1 Tax=Mycoemilia scoparia TaxID=417184 RepID=A0A9W7ZKL9_9FUNG|nr:glucosidase II [Mycoemilia scoparia]
MSRWLDLSVITSLFQKAYINDDDFERKFKVSKESSYYRRNRAYINSISTKDTGTYHGLFGFIRSVFNKYSTRATPIYELVSDSVKSDKDGSVNFEVLNTKDNVLISFRLTFHDGEIFRIRASEKDPLIPRYDEAAGFALVDGKEGPPLLDPSAIKATAETVDGPKVFTYTFGTTDSGKGSQSKKIRITEKPWKIEYLIGDEVVLQLNNNEYFNFEHHREKTEANEADVENGWSESFKNWTDEKPRGPESVGIDIEFPGFEHVYGIPEHSSPLSLKPTRGAEGGYTEPYRLYNVDTFEYNVDSPHGLYGSVPLMLAHNTKHTVGALWMSSAETWVDITKEEKSKVTTHWVSESGIMDIMVMTGPKPSDVFAQYAKATGTTAFPRDFSIAYHQCRWSYMSQKEVEEINSKFDDHSIPYDVIWLDIDYTDGMRYFTWNKMTFPDPEKLHRLLDETKRKVVTIIDPHIKVDEDYFVYQEAKENGYIIKDMKGKNFEGWCWPGSSAYIDFTNEKAREWWQKHYSFDIFKGSFPNTLIWNDMNEMAVFNQSELTLPRNLVHKNGWEQRDVHNLMGMLFHRSTFEGLVKREATPKRPFVLSRSYFAGSQRYGPVWTGDNAANWEHLAVSVPMVLSNSIAGIHFVGADVGGFFKDGDPELFTRWYQLGIWYPFFRGHTHRDSCRKEPWSMGEPHTSIIRDAILLRYRLLPYWYTLFRHSNVSGTPIARPLWVEFPEQPELFAEDKLFMVGSSLLIAPVLEPMQAKDEHAKASASEITIAFPKNAVWYDFFTHKAHKGGETLTRNVELSQIPAYVRGGSIVPTRERQRRSSELMRNDPYTLHIYVDEDGSAKGDLYIDDGETFDFEKGGYIHSSFEFSENKLVSSQNQDPKDVSIDAEVRNKYRESVEHIRIERIIVVGYQKVAAKAFISDSQGADREVDVEEDPITGSLVVRNPSVSVAHDWTIELKQQ